METFDLTQEAVLARLYIGQPGKARHSRTLGDEAAEKHKADRKSVRGIIQILQNNDLDEITNIVNAVRIGSFYRRTTAWDDNAYRLLPLAQFMDLKREFDGYKADFDKAVDKLVDRYDELKKNYYKRVNDLADEIPFPTKEQLKAGFQLQLITLPIAKVDDIRLKHMPAQAVEDLKREVKEDMAARLKDAQEEIIIRLIEVVSKMDGQLKKEDGRLFKSLVTNIKKQVEVLPALNVTGDADITRLINRVTRELTNVDIESLREDEKAKAQTVKVTASILKDLRDYGKAEASKTQPKPVAKEKVAVAKITTTKEVKPQPKKRSSIVGDFVGFTE